MPADMNSVTTNAAVLAIQDVGWGHPELAAIRGNTSQLPHLLVSTYCATRQSDRDCVY